MIKTFENTADVTHEERNDAINHVKEQLSLVFNAIEKDRKDIQVAQDELFGLNELNSIFINITQKPTARKAISGMASQLNNSINNTPYATEEERQIALNKVKAIVDDANEKIREANTDSEVLGTKSNAIHCYKQSVRMYKLNHKHLKKSMHKLKFKENELMEIVMRQEKKRRSFKTS